jgi:hypothetical protein
MLVAHVNWRYVETCANIKLSFFLHVPISLKKISFNIMGHGMDLNMEVLSPCLWTLPICTFMTMNLMMTRPMKIIMKNHGLLICGGLVTLDDTSPNAEQKKDQSQPSSSSTPTEKTFAPMGDIMQEIINEIKEGRVQLIHHTTSLLCVIAIDV